MVARNKTKGLRTVFLGVLAVLTVQCVYGLTTDQPDTISPTQARTQSKEVTETMYVTEVMTNNFTSSGSNLKLCSSASNCSVAEYCKLENSSDPGVCQSCHGSCNSCSGPGNTDCTSCNLTSFIVQHIVYDRETTTPTGTTTPVQTTNETTTTHMIMNTSRTTRMSTSYVNTSPDVTSNLTSSSTHPNDTTAISTSSTSPETTPTKSPSYTITVECVDQCPSDLVPPWADSKICCHKDCTKKGCYGNSHGDCCHNDCTTGCYGNGEKKCCPTNCDPNYGCDQNGKCRVELKNGTAAFPLSVWALVGIGVGIPIVIAVGIVAVCCCVRRRRSSERPRGGSDGAEENIGMKKRKSKKRKRNSYVPGPGSVREMNQDGPYANEEYTDPAGLANPAHQSEDTYDDVNVDPDSVYVEPRPESTDDDIYDQPPQEELNRHQGATNYGYHDDGPVYGNDPDQVTVETYPVSVEQYPVSIEQYPVSGDHYPVSGEQYPVSGEPYPVSGEQYPVSGEQYPVSGNTDQSGFASADPVYQNVNAAQLDLPIYENQEFPDSNPQPSVQDLPVYYDYTAEHNPDASDLGFPPPPPEDDEEQFPSIDSMPDLPPLQPPGDLPSLPPPPPPVDSDMLYTDTEIPPTQPPQPPIPSPKPPTQPAPKGKKKTRRVPPPPPPGPRPESARRVQRPPRVQVRRQPEPEVYGYENDQGEVYGYDN